MVEILINVGVHCPKLQRASRSAMVVVHVENGQALLPASTHCEVGQNTPGIEVETKGDQTLLIAKCTGCHFVRRGFRQSFGVASSLTVTD